MSKNSTDHSLQHIQSLWPNKPKLEMLFSGGTWSALLRPKVSGGKFRILINCGPVGHEIWHPLDVEKLLFIRWNVVPAQSGLPEFLLVPANDACHCRRNAKKTSCSLRVQEARVYKTTDISRNMHKRGQQPTKDPTLLSNQSAQSLPCTPVRCALCQGRCGAKRPTVAASIACLFDTLADSFDNPAKTAGAYLPHPCHCVQSPRAKPDILAGCFHIPGKC